MPSEKLLGKITYSQWANSVLPAHYRRYPRNIIAGGRSALVMTAPRA